MTTNIAAAAGAVTGMCVAWVKLGKPDISMMLNGALGALVAITAASGFVAPWAAIVIGVGSGFIAVFGVIFVERIGIDDPIGAVAVHGMSGVWGTLACGLFAVPLLAKNLGTGHGGLVYTGSFRQLGIQALGLAAVGAFTFSSSFGALFTLHKLWGIRVEPEVESQGLDVHEHGMWGYPEFYIPVPGGYGTESHGHLLGNGHRRQHHPVPPLPEAEPEPAGVAQLGRREGHGHARLDLLGSRLDVGAALLGRRGEHGRRLRPALGHVRDAAEGQAGRRGEGLRLRFRVGNGGFQRVAVEHVGVAHLERRARERVGAGRDGGVDDGARTREAAELRLDGARRGVADDLLSVVALTLVK